MITIRSGTIHCWHCWSDVKTCWVMTVLIRVTVDTPWPVVLGQFNYGPSGILDFDHKRLFTFRALRRCLEMSGFSVIEVTGIPAPFALACGKGVLAKVLTFLNQLGIWCWRGAFSYQIGMVVRPRPTLATLLRRAENARPPSSSIDTDTVPPAESLDP